MSSRLPLVLCLVFQLATGQGCATVVNGFHSDITFDTEPKGATVSTLDDGRDIRCVSPCVLEVTNDQSHVVRFDHPEFGTETRNVPKRISVWFWINFVWGVFGGVLLGVDWLTGGMWVPSKDAVFVNFSPEEDYEEEEEGQEGSSEYGQEEYEEESPVEDEPEVAPESGTSALPVGPAPLQGGGIESWESPGPRVENRLKELYPEDRLDMAIRQYYGEVDRPEKARILRRIFKILNHQLENTGETDLDMAISMEWHDRQR